VIRRGVINHWQTALKNLIGFASLAVKEMYQGYGDFRKKARTEARS